MFPRKSVLTLILAAVACAPLGLTQGRGTTGGTPPTGTTGGNPPGTTTGTTPGTSTTIPNTTSPPNTTGNNGIPQTLPISGRVLLEDGQPPNETVTIERVCNGSPRAEGYTDSKGYFFIELGSRNNGIIQDASEVSGPGNRSLGGFGSTNTGGFGGGSASSVEFRYAGCELRAKLAGYRSQSVNLGNRRPLDDPDIGTILLHRLSGNDAAGATVSAAMLEVPKDARKAFDKGMEAAKKGKTEDAYKDYSKAVELYRSYPQAWFELGKLQMMSGDPYTARGSFGEAIKADPKFLPGYVAIADIDIVAKKWRDVVAETDRAATLDAFDFPQVYFYNAVANYNLKNIDAAEKSVKEAERLDTRHQFPQIHYLFGLIQGLRHEYASAAQHLRTYLKMAPDGPDVPTAKKTLEQVEQLLASAQPQKDQ